MAIPAVTREYTPGVCRNSRNHMRHPPGWEMRLNSPALHAEQFLVPSQTVRNLDLLDVSTESPPEIPHKSRRTLMSPQECEISRGRPNQL